MVQQIIMLSFSLPPQAVEDSISVSSNGSDKRDIGKRIAAPSVTSDRSTKYSGSLSPKSLSSRSEWIPELVDEMSSKNLLSECDSGVNVVAQIDTLPFMG